VGTLRFPLDQREDIRTKGPLICEDITCTVHLAGVEGMVKVQPQQAGVPE
jgi:hypothetical protein